MKTIIILLLLFSTHVQGQEKGLASLDFFIGEWEITNIRVDKNGNESIVGKSVSNAYYVLDESVIMDEFRSLNSLNEVVFRGISIRSYNAGKDVFQITWYIPGTPFYTRIEAKWEDDIIVLNGSGLDNRGDFLEKLWYYDISDSSYSMKMDRSYDGGDTWIKNYGRFDANKVLKEYSDQ